MANEWHYTQNGQPAEAPVGTAQLKQLSASGQLKPDDLVWQEGMTTWVPASSIKGLFATAKSTTTETPAAPARSSTRSPKAEATKSDAKSDAKPAGKPAATVPADNSGLHPALVFLLTVLTVGLFGIFYAMSSASRYRARAGNKTVDASGRPLGVVCHPVLVLALSWLTFGFYLSYWVARVLRECADYTGESGVRSRNELSLMLIVPCYTVYLAVYRIPDMVRRAQVQAGLPETPAPLPAGVFLNPLGFFALPVLCMSQQEALNRVWTSVP